MRAPLAMMLLGLLPLVSQAAPGDLDPSFGTGGTAVVGPPGTSAQAVAVGSDGRIVLGGYEDFSRCIVARLLSDGSPDPAFGTNGVVTTEVGYSSQVRKVAVLPDGRVLAAIIADTEELYDTAVGVIRFLPDGSVDPTFGENGIVLTHVPPTTRALVHAMIVQPDGAIVVGGTALMGDDRDDGYRMFLVRYTADGALDASFGGDGIVTLAIGPYDDRMKDVVVDGDGRLVVAGYSPKDRIRDDAENYYLFALARVLPDGSLDASFGSAGTVLTDVRPGGSAFLAGLVLQDDGTIQAVGSIEQRTAPGRAIAVVRYDADGALEGVTESAPRGLSIAAVGRDADGRPLATGVVYADGTFASGNAALLRFTAAGHVDTAFGVGGLVTTDVAGFRDIGLAVTTDASGRIVVSGDTFDGIAQRMVAFRHAGGTCTDGAACDDGDPCTAGETCTAGACTGPAAPDGTACDDRSVCTSGETCTAGVCGGGSALACDDCYGCDAVLGCIAAPEPVCTDADASKLTVGRDGASPLTWRWRGDGPDTASPGMKLCIFEEPDDSDALGWVELGARTSDGTSCTLEGGCWRSGRRDLRYRSRGDGLTRIVWRRGKSGRDTIRVKAKGADLWTYVRPGTGWPLLVQLSDAGGRCWQSRNVLPAR